MSTENVYTTWDEYGLRHVAEHLLRSEDSESLESLRKLLLDFDYLQAKIKSLDIFALIADYNLLPGNKNIQLIKEALQLSEHVLRDDRMQLAGQLLGRLLSLKKTEVISLVEKVNTHKSEFPWLKPLISCLFPPGRAEKFTLTGHEDTIRAIDMTPDGHFVISGSYDQTIKVWDLTKPGGEPRTLKGHEDGVTAVALTPDGRIAVSGSWDGTVRVWDLTQPEPEPKTLLDQREEVYAVALTPDGRLVISGSEDYTIKVWDLTKPDIEPRTLDGNRYDVQAVAVTPDGRLVVSGTRDGAFQVWDLTESEPEPKTFLEHEVGINAVAITSDGEIAISGSGDHTIKVWHLMQEDMQSESLHYLNWLYKDNGAVLAVAMTPNGHRIVAGLEYGVLQVWDLFPPEEEMAHEEDQKGENEAEDENEEIDFELPVLGGHGGAIYSVAVTPDGQLAVSGSDDSTIKIWDLTNVYDQQEVMVNSHGSYITAVSIAPDGGRAFSWSWNNEIKEWDLTDPTGPFFGRKPSYLQYEGNHSVAALTPDGRLAVTGLDDGTLNIWKIPEEDDSWYQEPTPKSHEIPVLKPRVLPHALIMYLKNALRSSAPNRQRKAIRAVAVTPDGRLVISGSDASTIKLWNLTQRYARPLTLNGHENSITAIAITPDGRLAVSGSMDDTLRVWDLTRRHAKPQIFLGHVQSISAVAITPDGRLAISGTNDGVLQIWDLTQAKAGRHAIEGSTSNIRKIAVTPDGCIAVTSSNTPTIHVWDLKRFQLLAAFTGSSIINSVSISDHGRLIFAGGSLGEIYLFQLDGWRRIQQKSV